MNENKKMDRREFLKKLPAAAAGTAALLGFPGVIPASVLPKPGRTSPNDRIVMAGIGFGMMGVPNMQAFLSKEEVRFIALCDLDKQRLEAARSIVNEKYGNNDCTAYHDFRELCLRKDIDAVSIAVPDHWHAPTVIACARAGFDIYGEKPFSHSLSEGRAMVDTIMRYNRVWQTGSWQRSVANFHRACELARNGRIGKIKRVEVGLPSSHHDFGKTAGQETMAPPPGHLDYDFWLGPAPYAPYCPARVHANWRWNMDLGGGQLMDWVGHHVDIAHWGLGFDYTGPVEIEGYGEYDNTKVWNSPVRYRLQVKYADGTPMVIAGGHRDIRSGTKWIGDHGWIWCDRGGFETYPKELENECSGPNEIKLYKSTDHYGNFLDCVKNRRLTITPCEVAHRSASVGHLGVIAIKTGRKIRFDPEKEKIVGDAAAERLLGRSYRSPWHY